VKDDLDAIDAVTLADVAAVLSRHPLTGGTSLAVGPLAELAQPDSEWCKLE